jgi:hypothetical protein
MDPDPTTRQPSSGTTAPFSLVNYGENQYKDPDFPCMASIHAEVNAMHKLPYLPRHKRPKKVDLLVIRVNRGGSMGNSKPCLNCVQQMSKFLPMKGYTLDTIYYTTQNGIIVSEKFTDLLNSDTPYLSRFYKNKASGKM